MDAQEELLKIAQAIEAIEGRALSPDGFGIAHLRGADGSDLTRLALEAKSLLDVKLGPLNDFSNHLTVMNHDLQTARHIRKVIEGSLNHLQRQEQKAESVDATTGLLERKVFDPALEAAVAACRTSGEPLALIFIDVDRFKKVNDEHGHAKGDEVLAEVARRVMAVSKGKGRNYRYGGEEMVVVLPNFTRDEALALAERCRAAIEAKPCAGLAVTASFGVSVFPAQANSAPELIQTADKAMYDAKNLGRNLVRFFGEVADSASKPASAPSRKTASPTGISDDERKALRQRHFQGRTISCPKDGAILRTTEFGEIGKTTPTVLIHCPICGLSETL